MLGKVSRSKDAAQREAEILLALAHPNIVRCFGGGLSEKLCPLFDARHLTLGRAFVFVKATL